ncbi:MAG: hypothetical protein JNK11_01915 [Alphaproteobacteria bacterium]|nr:hypothetical protein [Alphaproteobacteria bacterium]
MRGLLPIACALAWLAADAGAQAQSSPRPAGVAATRADLDRELRYQWGRSLDPRSVKAMSGDVTCDGAVDQVSGHVDSEAPDGPFYRVTVVSNDGSGARSDVVSFEFGAGREQLCGDGKAAPLPSVALESRKPEEAEELVGQPACGLAIRIEDGRCDAIRLFWLLDGTPEERFGLSRN